MSDDDEPHIFFICVGFPVGSGVQGYTCSTREAAFIALEQVMKNHKAHPVSMWVAEAMRHSLHHTVCVTLPSGREVQVSTFRKEDLRRALTQETKK